MSDPESMSSLLIGALAGLGVAMPLGAIGVLLLRVGVLSGFRTAAAGAVAVGLVDAAYCGLAGTLGVVAGAWIAALGAAPALLSGVVLVALGAAGLTRRDSPVAAAPSPPGNRSSIGVFLRFAGLTAINPTTLLYFLALTATLNSTFDASIPAFVAGVGIASTAWQLGLIGVGAVLGGRLQPAGQRLLSAAGSAVVVALGVAALTMAAIDLLGG
jgi:threonine/homoserine/homoserine lactone efflux protein